MATVANNAQVSALYAAVFGRAPDKAGLDFWTAQLDGGATLATTAAGFVGHPVFTQTYGSLTNIQFVNQVYQNVLGSSGDSKGVQFWVNKLANEGYSKAQFIAEFVQGALTIDLAAQLAAGALTQAEYDAAVTRQNTLTNKADVGVSFANTFGASSNLSASTDASSANVVNDAAYKAAAAAIAGVTADKATVTTAQAAISDAAKTANPVGSLSGTLANAGTGLKLAAYQSAVKAESDAKVAIAKIGADNKIAAIDTASEVTTANLSAVVNTAQTAYIDAQKKVVVDQAAVDTDRVNNGSDADVAKAATAAQAEVTSIAQVLIDGTKANAPLVTGQGFADNNGDLVVSLTGSTVSKAEAAAFNTIAKALGLTGTVVEGADVSAVNNIFTASALSKLNADFDFGVAQAKNAFAVNALAVDVVSNGTDTSMANSISSLLVKLTADSKSVFYTGTDGKAVPADANAAAAVDAYNTYKTTASADNALALIQAAGKVNDSTASDTNVKAQYNSLQAFIDQRVTLTSDAKTANDTFKAATKPAALQVQADRDALKATVVTDQSDVTTKKATLDLVTKAQSDFAAVEKTLADSQSALSSEGTLADVAAGTTPSGNANKADLFVLNESSYTANGVTAAQKAFALTLDNSIDKLFIGTNYVQGADITKGNNSALEFFVKNDASGTAVVSVETSTFGSSAATPEVIQITLTGHSAADVSFASGFITTSAPATA